MFCPKCGKELADTAKFCSGCGEKIEQNVAPVENTPAEEIAAPVDPIAPVSSTEPVSSTIPTGNVVTGTLPAQETTEVPAGNVVIGTLPAQEAASEAPAAENAVQGTASTATATLPEMTDVLQANVVKPESKKFSTKTLIAAGAAAVGVVAAGVVVAGCTFAKADFAHTFMGNKKYATAVMGKQIEQVINTPALSAGMSAANVDTSSEESVSSFVYALASLKSSIPAAGAEIEVSLSADLSGENLDDFASELGCDTEKAKEILEAIRGLKLSGGIQFSETGIAATASGKEQGNEIIKVNALYDAETEAYYISLPGVSDECLMFADENAVIEMEDLNVQTDDKAAKEMLENVLKAYKDSLDDAEIVYERTTFSIGDVEFKGKMSSVTFEDDEFADMLADVSEEFFDSEYAESLGDVDAMQKQIDDMISDIEDADGVSITIENFVNSNNTVAGMRVEFEEKSGSSKQKSEIAYLNTKDGIAFSVEADGKKIIEFSQEKENNTTGKFTGKISDGRYTGKFTIDYENLKEKKMFGQKVMLGEYTIKFSGELFDAEDMPFDKITLKLTDEDDKLNYTVGVKSGSDTVNFKLALSEGISEKIDAETMKISGAYDALGEADKAKVNEFLAKTIEYFANQTKESEFFNSVPSSNGEGTLADDIQAAAKRALRERELVQNYSDYNQNSASQAVQIANRVYSSARYVSYPLKSSDAVKIKLYYDKDGRISILDNAGMSSIENDLLGYLSDYQYKKAYVEIVLWNGRGPVCGVNVVMTDDSSNIPDNLPDAYSFLDRQYKWGTDEDVNYVGSFVVGAYPRLANGEGGNTKTADEKLAADVKAYSADAQKAAKAMSEYTGFTFTEGKTSYIDFTITDGQWKYYTNGGGRITGSSADANAYMTEKVGEVGAKHVCFYYEGSNLIGAIATNKYYYSYFAVDDFKSGIYERWTYMDGVIDGSVVGTYPILTKTTSIPKDYVEAMVGTWVNGDSSITLTADDLKNVNGFNFARNGASITNIYVKSADKGNFYYYPNNGEPYISDGWKKYSKID